MTLKERLEAAWNDPEIRSPCHLNIWSEKPEGYTRLAHLGLYWRHGKLLGPKKQKVSKGYSFLPKFYGMVWRCKILPSDVSPVPSDTQVI